MTRRKDWIDKDTPGRKPGRRNEWAVVRLCLRCRQPFWATRWDAVTCSGKCRVWLHRHPDVLDVFWEVSRHAFAGSRTEAEGGLPSKRFVVGQWLHFLLDKDPETNDQMFDKLIQTAADRAAARTGDGNG